jgi:hypothetical protein
MSKPTLSEAALRTEGEAALANYHGLVTHCPPALPPKPDREELDLDDEDEAADDDAVIARPREYLAATSRLRFALCFDFG